VAIRETLDTIYLCWLCKPKAERELYRYVRQHHVTSIVELGLENLDRCLRLIRLAKRCSPRQDVRYAGIDQFDARSAPQPKLTLKQAHRVLSGSGASIRLIPGDAFSALARCANQLQGTQLLLIAPDLELQSLEPAWMYVPRMLSPDAIVLQAKRDTSGLSFQRLSANEVAARANSHGRHRRSA
jgi:hypothetical protein